MVILAAPVTDIRWIGSVIGLDLVGEVELHVPAGVVSSDRLRKYHPLPNYRRDILGGLVFVVRGLVCQLAEEVSRLWFQPSLLERRWRRGG